MGSLPEEKRRFPAAASLGRLETEPTARQRGAHPGLVPEPLLVE